MIPAVALAAIATGVAVALTRRPLTGWTLLGCLLICAGFALLIELTHPHVDVAPEDDL